jgi:hypothetical protein
MPSIFKTKKQSLVVSGTGGLQHCAGLSSIDRQQLGTELRAYQGRRAMHALHHGNNCSVTMS